MQFIYTCIYMYLIGTDTLPGDGSAAAPTCVGLRGLVFFIFITLQPRVESSSSLLPSSLELSDTGPQVRALRGTASHFYEAVVLIPPPGTAPLQPQPAWGVGVECLGFGV